jgi:hypothetical protein
LTTLRAPLPVRPLVIVLAVQVVLGATLVGLIATGTLKDWLTDDAKPSAPAPAAAAPVAQQAATARADRFDEERAWALLNEQVALGPRPAGSAALRTLAERLRKRLPRGRYEQLGAAHPGLRNIVGSLPGRGRAVVLAAHYDTKDLPGFVGANDGAGGTAAVVEIARALRKVRRRADAPPVRFVLFDGEEATDDRRDFYVTGVRGSKAYARRHARELRALILLDFVADKNLSIPREEGSDEALWARLRAAARRAGVERHFPATVSGEVIDDHTPFADDGVPAVDLIDWSYEGHDVSDTIDKLSKRSLDAVGETLIELVRRMDAADG